MLNLSNLVGSSTPMSRTTNNPMRPSSTPREVLPKTPLVFSEDQIKQIKHLILENRKVHSPNVFFRAVMNVLSKGANRAGIAEELNLSKPTHIQVDKNCLIIEYKHGVELRLYHRLTHENFRIVIYNNNQFDALGNEIELLDYEYRNPDFR